MKAILFHWVWHRSPIQIWPAKSISASLYQSASPVKTLRHPSSNCSQSGTSTSSAQQVCDSVRKISDFYGTPRKYLTCLTHGGFGVEGHMDITRFRRLTRNFCPVTYREPRTRLDQMPSLDTFQQICRVKKTRNDRILQISAESIFLSPSRSALTAFWATRWSLECKKIFARLVEYTLRDQVDWQIAFDEQKLISVLETTGTSETLLTNCHLESKAQQANFRRPSPLLCSSSLLSNTRRIVILAIQGRDLYWSSPFFGQK